MLGGAVRFFRDLGDLSCELIRLFQHILDHIQCLMNGDAYFTFGDGIREDIHDLLRTDNHSIYLFGGTLDRMGDILNLVGNLLDLICALLSRVGDMLDGVGSSMDSASDPLNSILRGAFSSAFSSALDDLRGALDSLLGSAFRTLDSFLYHGHSIHKRDLIASHRHLSFIPF